MQYPVQDKSQNHSRTSRQVIMPLALFLFAMFLLTGCAKLPMDNEPPSAPLITTDGVATALGVAFQVMVDDPDGDMVTVQFQATTPGGFPQTFNWTSFFASGVEETFLLNLVPLGQWTVTVLARDELNETSGETVLQLTVSGP